MLANISQPGNRRLQREKINLKEANASGEYGICMEDRGEGIIVQRLQKKTPLLARIVHPPHHIFQRLKKVLNKIYKTETRGAKEDEEVKRGKKEREKRKQEKFVFGSLAIRTITLNPDVHFSSVNYRKEWSKWGMGVFQNISQKTIINEVMNFF